MVKTLYPLYIIKYQLADGGEDFDSLPLFGTSEHQLIVFSAQESATNFYAHPFNLQVQSTLGAVNTEIKKLSEKEVKPLIENLSKNFPIGYLWLDPEMLEDGYDYNSGIHILLHAPIPGEEEQETDAVVLAQAIANMRKQIAQMQEKVVKWEALLVRLQTRTEPAKSLAAKPTVKKVAANPVKKKSVVTKKPPVKKKGLAKNSSTMKKK